MVVDLILSIFFSTCLFVILKSFDKWKVNTLQGIIFNYWTAASLSFFSSFDKNYANLPMLKEVWGVSLGIGFLFIVVFFIMAKTTQTTGVAVASVASKMSMVIPIAAGLLLYHESIDLKKAIGICLAFPAVYFTSRPQTDDDSEVKLSLKDLLLPLLLFVGAGMVDTSIKFAQHFYINPENHDLVIMSIFGSAGLFGVIKLSVDLINKKNRLTFRSLLGGIILGSANFLSLYFLLKCLAAPGSESSTIFALVNIGVVICSAGFALFLFSEKFDRNRIIGILLSLLAIGILSF